MQQSSLSQDVQAVWPELASLVNYVGWWDLRKCVLLVHLAVPRYEVH